MKLLLVLLTLLLLVGSGMRADEATPQRIAPGPGQESVWDYPLPPEVEETSSSVRVVYDGVVIAESVRSVRVLEQGHPPVYYIPQEDVRMEYLTLASKNSTCEYKGTAAYYDLKGKGKQNKNAAWSYPEPAKGYEKIRNYIAFYPGLMDACFVNGERVRPEPGDYFGGWITQEIVGPFKK